MVRLQCPRCQSRVKLGDDVIAAHPVVRCASCQGLIPVKQCLVQESPVVTNSKPIKPAKKRVVRKQRDETSNAPAILSVIAAVVILGGMVFGLYYASKSGTTASATSVITLPDRDVARQPNRRPAIQNEPDEDSYTALWDREEQLREKLLQQLESIHTVADAEAAVEPVRETRRELERTRKQKDKAAETMSRQEWQSNLGRYSKQAEKDKEYDDRYFAAVRRIESNPQLAAISHKLFDTQIGRNLFDNSGRPGRSRSDGGSSARTNPAENSGSGRANVPPFFSPNQPSSSEKNYQAMTVKELVECFDDARSVIKDDVIKALLLKQPTDEDRQLVLQALVQQFEGVGFRNLEGLFKLFKKWVKTQADKELFGPCVETLLKDYGLRRDVILWCGDNKVVSSSQGIARMLRDNLEYTEAAQALIKIGRGAEEAVIPYLDDLEPRPKHYAIEVLARIGTRNCIPGLRKLQNDPNVGLAAKQALRIVSQRNPEK